MDALYNDDDKLAMLRDCARVLVRPHGVIASISFSSQVCCPMPMVWLVGALPLMNIQGIPNYWNTST